MITRRCVLLLGALTFVACGNAGAADKISPAPTEWKASKNFKGDEARTNLSGAACSTKVAPVSSCLIVNDEKKYAQFFSIADTTLVPGDVIRLRDEEAEGDPDGEGAAYADGFFYITGSHGRARNSADKSSVPSYV